VERQSAAIGKLLLEVVRAMKALAVVSPETNTAGM
jgi:hypothetical protein